MARRPRSRFEANGRTAPDFGKLFITDAVMKGFLNSSSGGAAEDVEEHRDELLLVGVDGEVHVRRRARA